MTTERLASKLAQLIVRYVDPEVVILFGSVAQGRAQSHSDIDLLVVGSFSGPLDRRGLEFREAIAEIPVPIDVIFLTPEEYHSRVSQTHSFVNTVARHGRVMYVRQGAESQWQDVGAGRATPLPETGPKKEKTLAR